MTMPALLPPTATRSPCDQARTQRARVAGLLADGKLVRTARVIAWANRLCAEEASTSWAVEALVDAELGRYTEARALADRLDARADDAGKQAAAEARAIVDERDRTFPNTDDAKKEMRRLYYEATATQDGKNHSAARGLFLGAWSAWHPNGQALLGAGLSAQALGQLPEAQRLFDRATAEMERAQASDNDAARLAGRSEADLPIARVTPEIVSGLLGIEGVAWSPDGRLLAVVYSDGVALLDTTTWRERFRLRGQGRFVTAAAFAPDGPRSPRPHWTGACGCGCRIRGTAAHLSRTCQRGDIAGVRARRPHPRLRLRGPDRATMERDVRRDLTNLAGAYGLRDLDSFRARRPHLASGSEDQTWRVRTPLRGRRCTFCEGTGAT